MFPGRASQSYGVSGALPPATLSAFFSSGSCSCALPSCFHVLIHNVGVLPDAEYATIEDVLDVLSDCHNPECVSP